MLEPVAADPIAEITSERERARAAADPLTDVCVLATSGGQGGPGVRPLVLRDIGPDGLGLLISATSPKWEPLRSGRYECLLLWTTIRRQYRVRGGLAPMPEALVERYWRDKVHESRLLDLYYERVQGQSSRVASRETFLAGIEALRREHPTPDAVPRPPLLRGVYLVPFHIEVWHGSLDRLHARHLYARTAAGWREEVLVP
ncbi:MAG TPA: pyridoxine 5'-phosphate oxidase C-terminal domain-containing protein [Methylomirabilota bacterium]|nr:pyridoxine 5'-phosphate oxidase C-terminal domain-containing protein [Methylomirabilota bacterium]